MRLTLRTLLAYLDDILEAEDAQQLGQKIQESEVATQLMHRIRHVVGQLRGESVSALAEGLAKDANFVAEYLDNTMPPEKVAEFERLCLESDSLLAEVAACHQILTLVLGEPADIEAELKEKIYQLPHAPDSGKRVTAAPPITPQTAAGSPPVQPVAATTPVRLRTDEDEHWTEAPDYLKRRRSASWKPWAIAALIAFCLALAGLRGMGPLDRTHPLASWLGFGTEMIAQQSSTADVPGEPSETPTTTQETLPPADDSAASTEAPETEPPLTPPADLESPPGPTTSPEEDRAPEVVVPESTSEIESSEIVPPVGEPDAFETPAEEGPQPGIEAAMPLDVDEVVESPDAERAVEEEGTGPTMNIPDGTGTVPAEDVASSEAPTLINPLAPRLPDSAPDSSVVPPLPVPPSPEDLATDSSREPSDGSPPTDEGPATTEAGRFLSEDQLLLRFDSGTQLWQRLPSRAPLLAGEPLLALPTYRPQVMLSTGMQWTLVGPSRAVIELPDADETPHLRLEFGRVTLVTFARTGTKIQLSWNGRSALASFADLDTVLAIQLTREHIPGTNPEEADPHVILRVYPTSGSIEWQMDDAPAFHVPSGQQLFMVDTSPARLDDVEALPEWIDARDARPRDPFAARGLEENVSTDRSVALSLKEQADSRRPEVRSLAASSLAYLGDFDPLLVAMNDSGLRAYWSDQYRVLRECVALDRETAASVRQAIEQRHPDDGNKLYRMLWGYTAQELDEGAAEELVQHLDHPSSDFRVAAIETLKDITGTTSLFMPHYTQAQRRSAIFKWREKLNAGQIKYAAVPEIVQLIEVTPVSP